MTSQLLIFPAKQIRASIIREWCQRAGYTGIVCFSCGPSAEALKRAWPDVLEVGPHGLLEPTIWWWAPEEIRRYWPDRFDATSGHLPAPLMVRIAQAFREHLGALDPATTWRVPTGSGETIVCLRWAYPSVTFQPVRWIDGRPETQHDPAAPLNAIVGAWEFER